LTKKKIIKKSPPKKKVVPGRNKSIPKAEPKNENSVLEALTDKVKSSLMKEIIPQVVTELRVDLDKAVNGKFEDIKGIINNEMKDLRQTMALNNDIPQQIPQLQQPQNPPAETNLPAESQLGGQNTGEMITQILLSQLGGQKSGGSGMEKMFMEMMMRNQLNSMNRQDVQSQALTQAIIKRIVPEELGQAQMIDDLNSTNEALMNPIHKYGENLKKQQEEAKKE
jgi:hypothetical protein